MRAYHIRTSEPDPYDPMRLENFTLDSIYVPDKKILVGFVDWKNRKGKIVNYSNLYHYRAQAILEGNKEGIKGKVISEIDLDDRVIEIINNNRHESEVKISQEFDGSTNSLVNALTINRRKWFRFF